MGFRYHKRINLGDGVGINVSKSGVSTSVRTKYGSLSSKGFSIRTGIPGLTWRSGFGGKNAFPIMLAILLLLGAIIVAYNLIRLLIYLIALTIDFVFTENGFSLRNFLIVLFGLGSIGTAIYLYSTKVGSTTNPENEQLYTMPIYEHDTLIAEEPLQEKPKKKRERKKTTAPLEKVTSGSASEKIPSEIIQDIPTSNNEYKPLNEAETISNSDYTQSESNTETQIDVIEPTVKPNSEQGDLKEESGQKKPKWWQFKKRREERKKSESPSEADSTMEN